MGRYGIVAFTQAGRQEKQGASVIVEECDLLLVKIRTTKSLVFQTTLAGLYSVSRATLTLGPPGSP